VLPVWPEAPQAHQKQAIREAEFGLVGVAMEHGELMTEGQIFQCEAGMGLAAGEQGPQESQNDSSMTGPTWADDNRESTSSQIYGVFATHTGRGGRLPAQRRSSDLPGSGEATPMICPIHIFDFAAGKSVTTGQIAGFDFADAQPSVRVARPVAPRRPGLLVFGAPDDRVRVVAAGHRGCFRPAPGRLRRN